MRCTRNSWAKTEILLSCSFLFLLLLAPFQQGMTQVPLEITGAVVSRQSGEPVSYTYIYTKPFKSTTIADENGHFTLTVSMSDTLIFSSMGYEQYVLTFDHKDLRHLDEVRIEMQTKVYQLDPIEITAFPGIEQFKQDILDTDVPEKKQFALEIPKGYTLPPEGPGDVNLNPSVSISGPFSALYNAFSREAKEKRRLLAYGKKATDFKTIDSKYNLAVVRRTTDLDEEAAKRFMKWCKFEDDFILRASEYELAVAMLKCLDEFPKADTLR
jgi:CarboxypepD_reg-like domain